MVAHDMHHQEHMALRGQMKNFYFVLDDKGCFWNRPECPFVKALWIIMMIISKIWMEPV